MDQIGRRQTDSRDRPDGHADRSGRMGTAKITERRRHAAGSLALFCDLSPLWIRSDEGKLIPATGLTATQIAREGWGLQKSQNGGGTLPVPSPSSVTYHRYGSDRTKAN